MSRKRALTWREITLEFVVGAFFFAAVAILAVYTIILSRDALFRRPLELHARFPSISGLSDGDSILVRGVAVGRVGRIELASDGVDVTFRLSQPVTVYGNAEADVRYSSMLGGRYVDLNAGDAAAGLLPSDGVIAGNAPVDLLDEAAHLVRKLKVEVERISATLEDEQLLSKISDIIENFHTVAAELRAGEGTLGRLLRDPKMYDDATDTMRKVGAAFDDVKAAAAMVNQTLEEARAGKGPLGSLLTDDGLYNDIKAIAADLRAGKGTLGKLLVDDELYANFRELSLDLKRFSGDLAQGKSSLGRFVADDGALYLSLRDTLEAAKEITGTVRAGQGTLGRLVTDESLFEDARKAVDEVRGAVEDFREQAPVSTFGSLIFGAF